MELRDQLQSTLGDAYTIEHELTGGGMARVFVAHETTLGRKVVVKPISNRRRRSRLRNLSAQGLRRPAPAREWREWRPRTTRAVAIALFERALATSSPYDGNFYEARWSTQALSTLGDLYEARGDRAKAAEYYERYVEVLRDADPPVAAQVAAVRAKLARLKGG